jgi:hypothetical protein
MVVFSFKRLKKSEATFASARVVFEPKAKKSNEA